MISDFQSLRHDYVDLKKDYEERTKAHKELMRKQKAERDYTFKIKQDLTAANTKLTMIQLYLQSANRRTYMK